ncbi:MAG: hypothetical protein RRZ84_00205 [Romboutsia sp.]
MRKTYRRKNLEEISKQILFIGLAFIVFVVVGAYLNKIWTSNSNDILKNINPAIEYYSSDISSKKTIISNLKADMGFMGLICVSTLFVITVPVAVIIFMLKGLSMGYTINSFILALKFESIKMISIVMLKNIIIIPGAIILILISLSYFKEMTSLLKIGNREKIIFLSRRYLLNGAIIILTSVVLQLLLNTVSINIIKFLVK